jgi:hypothetical protein
MWATRVGVTLVGLASLALGGWAMYAEAGPVLRGGETARARIEATAASNGSIGAGLLTTAVSLSDCEQVLLPFGRPATEEQLGAARDGLLNECEHMARTVLERTPAHGQAELLLGLIAEARGDIDSISTHLSRSQALQPSLARVVSPRTGLGQRHFDQLSPDAQERHRQDLALMLQSGRGVWPLADLYVSDEAARQRITTALEGVPARDQARFVYVVQRVLRARGGA